MRVLVTGASGFIGAHVVGEFLASGDEVWAHCRGGAPAGLWLDQPREPRVLTSDLGDFNALLAASRPDVVVHLAWYTKPSDYLSSRANLGSLELTNRLFECTLSAGARLVGCGTCVEYERTDSARSEDSPCAPESLYGASKHAAYLVGSALASQLGGSFAWARIFGVFGPREAPARLVPAMLRSLNSDRPFALSPGAQVRDWLHVCDVARGLVALAKSDQTGPVNICSGQPATLKELAGTAALFMGRPDLLRFGGRSYAPNEQMVVLGDPTRLRQIGWKPRFDGITAAMADTVDAFKAAQCW